MAIIGVVFGAVLLLQNKKRSLRYPVGYPVRWGTLTLRENDYGADTSSSINYMLGSSRAHTGYI